MGKNKHSQLRLNVCHVTVTVYYCMYKYIYIYNIYIYIQLQWLNRTPHCTPKIRQVLCIRCIHDLLQKQKEFTTATDFYLCMSRSFTAEYTYILEDKCENIRKLGCKPQTMGNLCNKATRFSNAFDCLWKEKVVGKLIKSTKTSPLLILAYTSDTSSNPCLLHF